ncbi:MAG: DMT family transporter [Planctomycetes bacterium]|nr:DMT family transporter [Planctomycetota bacterium]
MNEPQQPRPMFATLMLLIVCTIWAGAFSALKIGGEAVEHVFGREIPVATGAFFLCVRFTLAGLAMPLAMPRIFRRLDRRAITGGVALGVCFSAHMLLQVVGLATGVSAGESAFLTALFVVITPLLQFAVLRRVPRPGVLVGVPFAVAGAALIKGIPQSGLTLGAWLSVAAAAAYGVQIIVTDRVTRDVNTNAQTFVMIWTCAAITGLALLLAPGGVAMFDGRLGALAQDSRFWLTEGYLSVISTVGALALVNRFQRETTPARAAVLFTVVPVLAAVISIALGREPVTEWLALGAGLILIANICAQFIGRRSV